jgi:putative FmdB family regulatory protein
MPTYEYKCRECANQFEVVQSFSDKPLKKCKECGGTLGKVFGNIGIAFKGSGFYRTDSRSTSAPKAKGDSGSKSETKSDSTNSESTKTETKKTESAKSESKPAKTDSKPAKAKESAA